jgi:hypothetical protein
VDLRSFSSREVNQDEARQSTHTQGGMSENDVRRAIKYFSGMSNDQLMRELSKHLSRKRAEGKESEVKDMIERIKPLLNDEQRARLQEIIQNV